MGELVLRSWPQCLWRLGPASMPLVSYAVAVHQAVHQSKPVFTELQKRLQGCTWKRRRAVLKPFTIVWAA
eukprot:4133778-Amphidinium_carterae.1